MLRSMLKWSGQALALAAVTVLFGAGSLLAQQGSIEGTVRNANTGDPIVNARVVVVGTQLAASTNPNGYYAIQNVPVGTHTVRVRVLGFRQTTLTNVLVTAGLPTPVNFSLAASVLRIEGVVVTGVAGETQAIKLPFTVDEVTSEELPVPGSNPAETLRAKVAGARVIKGSGRPGSATSVLLRGATSINTSGRSNEPLYVVDGVILGASLVDIDALDIREIEVVKGAAAAALYGARAANGVVSIKTQRGADLPDGETRVTIRSEFGKNALQHRFPLSESHFYKTDGTNWLDALGNPITTFDTVCADPAGQIGGCNVIAITAQAALDITSPRDLRVADLVIDSTLQDTDGDGVGDTFFVHTYAIADNPYPGQLFDHFDRFVDPGTFYTNSISVSHRSGSTNFLASAYETQEPGIVFGLEGYLRRGARVNVDHAIARKFDFRAGAMFSQSESDLENDGFGDAPTPFFSLPRLEPDLDLLERYPESQKRIDQGTGTARDSNDYIAFVPFTLEENPIYTSTNQNTRLDRGRFLGSLGLRWRPTEEFDVEAEFSFDRSDRNTSQFWFKGYREIDPSPLRLGRLIKTNAFNQALNASLTGAFTKRFGDLGTLTKARVLLERNKSEFIQAQATDFLVEEVEDLDNADANQAPDQLITGGTAEVRSLGYFFTTQLDFKDRYIIDALARRDGSSLFGALERWHWYYRVGGAYRMALEPWWPLGLVDEFKLRVSRGTAGGRPSFSAQYETFSLAGGVVSKANLGNRLLKPEFATETEFGVDLILAGRASLSVNHARSTIEDQILPAPLPGFAGFGSQFKNIGTLETRSWEATLQLSLIQRPDLNWNWSFVWDRTRGTVTELDVPPFFLTTYHYVRKGDPLGRLWGDKFATSCTDVRFDTDADGAGDTFYAPGACLVQNGGGFDINDDGYLVPVGAGNVWTDGIDKNLYNSTVVIDGVLYGGANPQGKGWGFPIIGDFVRVDTLGFDAAGVPIVQSDTSRFSPIGNSVPDFNFGISQSFQYKGVSLYALVDAQIGGDIYTNTRQWGCRDQTCWEFDQRTQDGTLASGAAGAPENTKKPIDYITILYNVNAPASHFVEDGTYVKLREVALRYTFGRGQLEGIFRGLFKRISLNLIGRNLLTFTDYTGYDPEVSTAGAESALLRIDAFGYPNFRTFTGSVELEF